ncbi:MAG: hypothetical protein M1824_001527 [Vezdaea acicularis]|nr:MAG: hypothetical protein M1824_001527 [Vezdaea acicularis]
MGRADSSSSSGSSVSQTASNTASSTASGSGSSTITSAPSSSGGSSSSASGSASNSNSDSSNTSGSSSGSQTATGTSNGGSSSNTTIYDPRLPAGGVQMVTPAATSGSQYYKVGDQITFGWNFTSLSATPSAVDVFATCTSQAYTYTLASNQSIGSTAVTWDTGAVPTDHPLLTDTYTLIIFDAASGVSATAQAGYLAVFDSFSFGMYTPQPYTPLNDFICATCSAGLSQTERQALGFMLGMAAVTVLSFSWFVGGLGLF